MLRGLKNIICNSINSGNGTFNGNVTVGGCVTGNIESNGRVTIGGLKMTKEHKADIIAVIAFAVILLTVVLVTCL